MKLVVLDGSTGGDPLARELGDLIRETFHERGIEMEWFAPADMNISYCLGDFKCWTRTPGVCALDDDNREIARAVARCDLLIYLTPVTFGGYSSHLKKAVDHLIQIISPFFTKYRGETHHELRYEKPPQLLALGMLPSRDQEAEHIFSLLVERNAINLHTRGRSMFVYRDQAGLPAMIREELQLWPA